ncbi:Phosphatidylinositol 3- and 4-kinase family protein [Cryptosporidium felis]|nr:Phosphatidylinositol 3- and 4-kinase family protein [Cryptosporidium felis]
MIIKIEYVAISLDRLFYCHSLTDECHNPIALRIQCEQYLIDSYGNAVLDSKQIDRSELILIEPNTCGRIEKFYINFEINILLFSHLIISPLCNYSTIIIFKFINENHPNSNEETLGYSLFPIINTDIENRIFFNVPIVKNETINRKKNANNLNIQLNQVLSPNNNPAQLEKCLNSASDILLGYLHIFSNYGEGIRSFNLSDNYEKQLKDESNLFNTKSTSNIPSGLMNLKIQESIQRYNQISLSRKIGLLEDTPFKLTTNSISIEGILSNRERLQIESTIHQLYLVYITKFDDKNSLKSNVDFIWKHRFHLAKVKSGIPLLLHFVDMTDKSVTSEIEYLIEFLKRSLRLSIAEGKGSILHLEDSINLLSREYKDFLNIRIFAIENLEFCTKEELFLILPQLVQALRYETKTHLIEFLKKKVAHSLELCIELIWLLISEVQNQGSPEVFEQAIYEVINELTVVKNAEFEPRMQNLHCCRYHFNLEVINLLLCQIQFRATLLWIHRISIEESRRERAEKKIQKFHTILADLETGKLSGSSIKVNSYSIGIDRIIIKLLDSLKFLLEIECEFLSNCRKRNILSSRITWNEEYENSIANQNKGIELPILNIINLSDPLVLPIDINAGLIGVVPNECFIVKSSLCPIILSCRMAVMNKNLDDSEKNNLRINLEKSNSSESIYRVVESKFMYKVGDDLRQDRLVIQLFEVSYKILKEWNIQDSVTLYRITPFSRNDGLIEFLENFSSIGSIRKKFGKNCILNYWATAYDTTLNKIPRKVIDSFISSCAAYSVITFILGVGDRHLDNLLIGKTGHFLHVDFGYIFGEDPKPFPPPMKICSEMIEAMGGLNSSGFRRFVDKCCECYRYIRRRSWLIFNLILLMVDSGIKDLNARSESNYTVILEKIKEKFRLDLTEKEAENYLREIIMTSSNALFPAVVDTLHDWALYWA